MMSTEIVINEKQDWRAALVHNISQAATRKLGEVHTIIGADLVRKYADLATIVNAIAASHGEAKAETILAPLVDPAEAISRTRPGVCREVTERCIRRWEDSGCRGRSIRGVERSCVAPAERERCILVEMTQASDEGEVTPPTATRRIDKEIRCPAEGRVAVVCELRVSQFAR